MRQARRLFVTAVMAMLLAAPAFAAETATAIGKITDESGAALPGATITARNVATGVSRFVESAPSGGYRVPALPPGQYELTASLAGFATVKRTGVILSVGAEFTLDFQLKVAALAEEITVNADASLVNTTSATVQTVVRREQIDLLPLISRDFQELTRLAPGVGVIPAQGEPALNVAGNRNTSNQYSIDGLDNSEDIVGLRRQPFNLEGIQEFQVQVNNFKAESGRASGAVVNVVTRPGTNQFRGSAFYVFRNKDMIARNPFLAPGAAKDPFERRQWGAAFGGPLVKDKTHFFLTFEKAEVDSESNSTAPYPLPGAVISPATQAFLAQHGVPPFPDTSGGRLVRLVRDERARGPGFTARVDHQLSNDQSLTFRLNWRKDTSGGGTGRSVFDSSGQQNFLRSFFGSVAHKWVRSSHHLNELYFQAGQVKAWDAPTFPTLPSVFVDEFSPFATYLGLGPFTGASRTDYVYQLIDNYTINLPGSGKGSHVLKFGGDVKVFRSDSAFDINFRGSFFFRTVADFLAGRSYRFTQNRGNSQLERPNTSFGVYVQDDWTLGSKLTLNLGLRYDYENAKTQALKEVTNSPACGTLITCGEAGPGISGDKNNVSPRFGFNWNPWGNGKTVIHGGAGIFYDRVQLTTIGQARFTPPKVVGIQIDNPSFPNVGGALAILPPPSITVVDEDFVAPRTVQASLGVRREISSNLAVDATLAWNRGYDHSIIMNINSIDPVTRRRPNPNFTNITLYTPGGDVKYRALFVEVKKRWANRHSWGIAYTLAKGENTTEAIVSSVQDPRDIQRNFGPGLEDRRHVMVANALVRLPWGFDFGGILEFRSERSLNVIAGGRDLNGDGIFGDWPAGYSRNSVHELPLDEANRLRSLFGLAPIASFANNPWFWDVDVTLQKSFSLGGHRRLKLTGECFNVTNAKQLAIPEASVTSTLFGRITAIDTVRGARPRSFQVTAQVDF